MFQLGDNKVCVVLCNVTEYKYSLTVPAVPSTDKPTKTCVKVCTAPYSYVEDGNCVIQCNTGKVAMPPYFECQNNCDSIYPYNLNGVCVKQCDTTKPYVFDGVCSLSCENSTLKQYNIIIHCVLIIVI